MVQGMVSFLALQAAMAGDLLLVTIPLLAAAVFFLGLLPAIAHDPSIFTRRHVPYLNPQNPSTFSALYLSKSQIARALHHLDTQTLHTLNPESHIPRPNPLNLKQAPSVLNPKS